MGFTGSTEKVTASENMGPECKSPWTPEGKVTAPENMVPGFQEPLDLIELLTSS